MTEDDDETEGCETDMGCEYSMSKRGMKRENPLLGYNTHNNNNDNNNSKHHNLININNDMLNPTNEENYEYDDDEINNESIPVVNLSTTTPAIRSIQEYGSLTPTQMPNLELSNLEGSSDSAQTAKRTKKVPTEKCKRYSISEEEKINDEGKVFRATNR